ncbi:MAG: OmpA family protein [Steroidobacteraceae bacterium]
MKHALLIFIALCLATPASGQGRASLTDHPLVSAYDGSTIRRKDVKEFDEYNAFKGMDAAGKEPIGLALEGKVTKILYANPKDRSILEIFRNYQDALAKAGATVLFTCNQEKSECAQQYARPTMQKYSGISAVANTVGRYLLAQLDRNDQTAYVAIAVGQGFTDVHVIEVKQMDKGMASIDAAALGKGLDSLGYVVVEGIYFDTDKATLTDQSSAALQEMAKLLKSRPSLNVYIVGHTDTRGSLAHNLSLSEARAKAVVQELADKFGVDSGRMAGYGVGPLAPQANNSTDAGRARNRRVVLVTR